MSPFGLILNHQATNNKIAFQNHLTQRGCYLCLNGIYAKPVTCGKGLKGCGTGPWLVLVSPCFRENVVTTCKIGSFLCSLDNLLQKNIIVFFFANQILKWRSFEKRGFFWPTFHIFTHQGKVTKSPLAHISLTYTYFAHPIDFFLPYQFKKKIRIYRVRFLFGMSPGVDSYSRHFGTINK